MPTLVMSAFRGKADTLHIRHFSAKIYYCLMRVKRGNPGLVSLGPVDILFGGSS
jgi:hypothetical protein